MMELRIKGIDRPFEFSPGALFELIVESPTFLYKLVKAFWNYDDETIVVADGAKIGKTQKEILYVDSFCDLNPNSKTALTVLYKNAEKGHMNELRRQELNDIGEKISSLLFDVSTDFNQSVEFDSQIDLGKLMQLTSFKYANNEDCAFFSDFLTFVKASTDSSSFRFLVTRDLFSFLNPEFAIPLSRELGNYGISLLDISAYCKNGLLNDAKIRIIDQSLCEIYRDEYN